jgi:hypothetical protein
MLTKKDLTEIEKRLNNSALTNCDFNPYTDRNGAIEYDVFSELGEDSESVAMCYDKDIAEFFANAALDMRLLLNSYRAVMKYAGSFVDLSALLGFAPNAPKVTDFYKAAPDCVYASFEESLTESQRNEFKREGIETRHMANPGPNRYMLTRVG